jgi:hypothetical protein
VSLIKNDHLQDRNAGGGGSGQWTGPRATRQRWGECACAQVLNLTAAIIHSSRHQRSGFCSCARKAVAWPSGGVGLTSYLLRLASSRHSCSRVPSAHSSTAGGTGGSGGAAATTAGACSFRQLSAPHGCKPNSSGGLAQHVPVALQQFPPAVSKRLPPPPQPCLCHL